MYCLQLMLFYVMNHYLYLTFLLFIGHEGSVTIVDAVYKTSPASHPTLLIATASVDSTVRIWERHIEGLVVFQNKFI